MKKEHETCKGGETMKFTKKKVLVTSLAISIIAILSFGTIAWFTAEDSVTNKFYVGDTDTEADEVFGIDLWENRDTNGDGDYNEEGDAEKAEGLTYETILPGEVLSKEPHLENTGIHPQYVRAIVTVSEADILKVAMTPKGADVSEWFDVEKFLPGTSDKWTLEYKYHTNKDTFVFVYYYNEVLAAGAVTEKLFDAVVIPTEFTKEQAAQMDNFDITILGQAIQSEHLADPANPGQMITNAKDAFATYWDEEGVVAGVVLDKDLAVEGSTVPNASPLTGTVTAADTLIEYNPDLYQDDPETRGILVMSDLSATVKQNVDMVTFPADTNNGMILITDSTFTVEEGGTIVNNLGGPSNTVMIYGEVIINGVEMNSSNWDTMVEKYFPGVTVYR